MSSYIVDLTKIQGKGSFKCPNCGIEISPDDDTKETFIVLEPVMKGDSLEKIFLQCKKCQITIQLTGFNLLTEAK